MGNEPKNILLISSTDKKEMSQVKWLGPPLGLLRLAGYLNHKGHNAEWIDTNKTDNLEEKLKEKSWDVIGVSVLDNSMLADINNIYLARKLCPSALLVAGGIGAQFDYQAILDKSPCKIVILGEGEIPFLKIVNGEPLENIPGIVFRKDAQPLSKEQFLEATENIEWEKIPYEDYWDFYMEKHKDNLTEEVLEQIHTVRIFTRNRCPMGCNFCASTNQLPLACNRPVLPIDIINEEDRLINIIKRIKKAHPRLRTIYFTDDEFCMNSAKVISFCKKIIAENLKLRFICLARVDSMTEEMVSYMSMAGFRVIILGVESFCQRTLNDFNKKYNTEIVDEKIQLLKKYNIHPFVTIILISPNSTMDDLEMTVDKELEYVKDDSVTSSTVLACIPFKGSKFNEEYFDFVTEVVEIPGTNYKIKNNIMILANDPQVREVQLKFFKGINREIEKLKDKHLTAAKQTQIRLNFIKKLIQEVRNNPGKENLMASKVLCDADKDKYQGL